MENRDSFMALLTDAALFTDEDIARVEMAYDLSKYAHRAQLRKDGERVFEHPRRAARSLLDRLKIYDLATVIAALLHDGYEDASRYVTPTKVRILGGEEADRQIRLLSKVPNKEGYVERLWLYGNWLVLSVKLCDRDDNMRTLGAGDEEFQRKQTIETRDVYLPLFHHLVTITPPSHRKLVAAMVKDLEDIVIGWCLKLDIHPPCRQPE